ncbi:unnamed protein product [Allacma fusca]|uniref:Uncharacterized protein n=1 Tax=Allacma fusca TaxID=39272 RepID=A0A8J2P177_9HEXA|nr:unnamed protein product [Allacma fusca]
MYAAHDTGTTVVLDGRKNLTPGFVSFQYVLDHAELDDVSSPTCAYAKAALWERHVLAPETGIMGTVVRACRVQMEEEVRLHLSVTLLA